MFEVLNKIYIMKYILYLSLFCAPILMCGQIAKEKSKEEEAKKIYAENWKKDLTEKGIEIKGDSLYISNEYKKALNDDNYRKVIYPDPYLWEVVAAFIKLNKLKPAFWGLINLYSKSPEDKERVMKFVITYDQFLPMDEILVATFYTYSFMDPETSVIKNGELETVRPDILEQKLKNVNDMVSYLLQYREQQKKEKK